MGNKLFHRWKQKLGLERLRAGPAFNDHFMQKASSVCLVYA